MPRARNLKPSFFLNEDLAKCAPLARLLFQGLWSLADCEGRLEDRVARIRASVLPYDEDHVDEWLTQLQEHGFILRYVADGGRYIQIVSWVKHARPHPQEKSCDYPPPPATKTFLPRDAVKNRLHHSSLDPACHTITTTTAVSQRPPEPAASTPVESVTARATCAIPTDSVRCNRPGPSGLMAELEKRSVWRSVASELLQRADPALIEVALGHFDVVRKTGRLKDPPAALRTMIENPADWGIAKVDGIWQAPRAPNDKTASIPLKERRQEYVARMARERGLTVEEYRALATDPGVRTERR